jgi:adenosine deaminase
VPTVLELARRHPDGTVPRSAAELAAFYEFRDFPHFSQVYGAVSSLVREPADVTELVAGAARDLAGQNVRYVELTVRRTRLRRRACRWPGSPRRWTSRPVRPGGSTGCRWPTSSMSQASTQLAQLAANGVRASFLDSGTKQALLAEIDAVAAGGVSAGSVSAETSA